MVKNVSTLMIVITFREKEAKLKKKKGQKCLHIDDCNHIFFSIEFDHRFHLLLHFSCLLMTCLIFVNVYILRLLLFTRLYFYIFLFYQMVKSWCTLINAFLSSIIYPQQDFWQNCSFQRKLCSAWNSKTIKRLKNSSPTN